MSLKPGKSRLLEQPWSAWGQSFPERRDSEGAGSAAEPSTSHPAVGVAATYLPSQENKLFGFCPIEDDFLSVRCLRCSVIIKENALRSHIAHRHDASVKSPSGAPCGSPPWLNSPLLNSPPCTSRAGLSSPGAGCSSSGSHSPELDPGVPPSQQQILRTVKQADQRGNNKVLEPKFAVPTSMASFQKVAAISLSSNNIFDRMSLAAAEASHRSSSVTMTGAADGPIPKVRLKLNVSNVAQPLTYAPSTSKPLIIAQPHASSTSALSSSSSSSSHTLHHHHHRTDHPHQSSASSKKSLKIRLMKSKDQQNLWTSSPLMPGSAPQMLCQPQPRPPATGPRMKKPRIIQHGLSVTPPPRAALLGTSKSIVPVRRVGSGTSKGYHSDTTPSPVLERVMKNSRFKKPLNNCSVLSTSPSWDSGHTQEILDSIWDEESQSLNLEIYLRESLRQHRQQVDRMESPLAATPSPVPPSPPDPETLTPPLDLNAPPADPFHRVSHPHILQTGVQCGSAVYVFGQRNIRLSTALRAAMEQTSEALAARRLSTQSAMEQEVESYRERLLQRDQSAQTPPMVEPPQNDLPAVGMGTVMMDQGRSSQAQCATVQPQLPSIPSKSLIPPPASLPVQASASTTANQYPLMTSSAPQLAGNLPVSLATCQQQSLAGCRQQSLATCQHPSTLAHHHRPLTVATTTLRRPVETITLDDSGGPPQSASLSVTDADLPLMDLDRFLIPLGPEPVVQIAPAPVSNRAQSASVVGQVRSSSSSTLVHAQPGLVQLGSTTPIIVTSSTLSRSMTHTPQGLNSRNAVTPPSLLPPHGDKSEILFDPLQPAPMVQSASSRLIHHPVASRLPPRAYPCQGVVEAQQPPSSSEISVIYQKPPTVVHAADSSGVLRAAGGDYRQQQQQLSTHHGPVVNSQHQHHHRAGTGIGSHHQRGAATNAGQWANRSMHNHARMNAQGRQGHHVMYVPAGRSVVDNSVHHHQQHQQQQRAAPSVVGVQQQSAFTSPGVRPPARSMHHHPSSLGQHHSQPQVHYPPPPGLSTPGRGVRTLDLPLKPPDQPAAAPYELYHPPNSMAAPPPPLVVQVRHGQAQQQWVLPQQQQSRQDGMLRTGSNGFVTVPPGIFDAQSQPADLLYTHINQPSEPSCGSSAVTAVQQVQYLEPQAIAMGRSDPGAATPPFC